MSDAAAEIHRRAISSVRLLFRSSEPAVLLLAVVVGVAAGLLTIAVHESAHALQALIFGAHDRGLSASASLSPLSLVALPIAGLVLGFGSRAAIRRWRTPIDVVEANALHGGVIPWRDSVLVCVQTLLSNGAGA